MTNIKQKYLKILAVELDDLQDDIEALEARYDEDRQTGELPGHVYFENLAVLKNEVLGVGELNVILDGIELDDYETLDDLAAHLYKAFEAKIDKHGLLDAVKVFVKRKMDKVKQYVEHCA